MDKFNNCHDFHWEFMYSIFYFFSGICSNILIYVLYALLVLKHTMCISMVDFDILEQLW